MAEKYIDIKYNKPYGIFIPKLKRYPRGVNLPLKDGSGKVLVSDKQTITVTEKEANSLVVVQKLFTVMKKKKVVADPAEIKEEGGDS